MKNLFKNSLFCVFLFYSCTTATTVKEPISTDNKKILNETLKNAEAEPPEEAEKKMSELGNIEQEAIQEYEEDKGVIFAKTDFLGVLKTRFVRLFFEHTGNEEHKFQLNIGEAINQGTLPWKVKTVEPGYFFIELPAGDYKITSISIPVGTTLATEEVNIDVKVLPNAITYIGTLKVIGTKERIKLGGVPVIRPGFEYILEILDEHEEGLEQFKQRYPDVKNDIKTELMQNVQPQEEPQVEPSK